MIIRAIEVENWCCIDRARLTDLTDGVTVVYGPNRAGKSSLFRAVRSCLYDYDHDSGHKDIVSGVPWTTRKAPRVTVEFETGGVRYRLSKVFSKSKDGMASLERWAGERWVVDIKDPKEASRKAREILGTPSSNQGLNLLLWLEQGATTLPDERELRQDSTLEKRLESVLGTLVTSDDIDFKKELDGRCSRWFTEKMADRSSSPLVMLKKEREKGEETLASARDKLTQADQTFKEFMKTEVEITSLEEQVAESKDEVAALQTEQRQSQKRRQEHEKALMGFKLEEREFELRQEEYDNYRRLQQVLAKAETGLVAAQALAESAEEEHKGDKEALEQAEARADDARSKEDRHSERAPELQDRRRLVDLGQQLVKLKGTIATATGIQSKVAELDDYLLRKRAPSEKELKDLNRTALEIFRLRTELRAGGLDVIVTSEGDQTVRASCDSKQSTELRLVSGEPSTLSVQQRVVLEIPAFGTVEAGRHERDLDLEKASRECAALEQQFHDSIVAWDEDPKAADALERLAQRTEDRKQAQHQLDEAKARLEEVAPKGIASLIAGQQGIEAEVRALLTRRPILKEWTPDEEALRDLEKEYQQTSKALADLRKAADQETSQARTRATASSGQWVKVNEAKIKAETSAKNLRVQLTNMGDSVTLEAAFEKASKSKEKAQKEVTETALTEVEKTVEDRLEGAEAALEQRTKRLIVAQQTLGGYRGELKATEGLHAEVAEAERALQEISFGLERETLEAQAHKCLRRLFEEARDSQVRSTMEPIRERVLGWIKHLGLDDYRDFAFAESYFPKGLVLTYAAADSPPVPFSQESFGTEEQLALLVRLALGGVLARNEPEVTILDDPLAHADPVKHRSMLDILKSAAEGTWPHGQVKHESGRLQLFVLTCHPDRFDYLSGARQIDFVHEACQSTQNQ